MVDPKIRGFLPADSSAFLNQFDGSLPPQEWNLVPDDLKDRDQWVLWKSKPRPDGRVEKKPLQPNGYSAKTNDPQTWSSFDQVVKAFASDNNRSDGIGFVFSSDDPYVGVDMDKCVDPASGVTEDWAESIVAQLSSYTERSVSGQGLHTIVKANLPTERRKRMGQLEIYSEKRFFVFTGDHLQGSPKKIESRQAQMDTLLAVKGFLPSGRAVAPGSNNRYYGSLRFNAKANVPVAVWKLIEQDEKLQGLWSATERLNGQNDGSPSGFGKMLISQLALRGCTSQNVLDTLIAFRVRHNGDYKPETWYRRELSKAMEWAGQQKAAPRISDDSSLVRAVLRHTQYESSFKPIDVCILVALAAASLDGEYARISAEDIAAQSGVVKEHVQKHLRKVERLGCIAVVEKARKWRPKRYRFNLTHAPPSGINPGSPTHRTHRTNSGSTQE